MPNYNNKLPIDLPKKKINQKTNILRFLQIILKLLKANTWYFLHFLLYRAGLTGLNTQGKAHHFLNGGP